MNHNKDYLKKVERITFNQFKKMAQDDSLSPHEKIGFPNEYREQYTEAIFNDICNKLQALNESHKKIADIGCGCDALALKMLDFGKKHGHQLYMLDSQEMLDLLPNDSFVHKVPGQFPKEETFLEENKEQFDAILVYSVMQHIILEDNPFTFIDRAVDLLAPGGRILLGDLPNRTKRKRFFLSPEGIRTHQDYTNSNEIPKVDMTELEPEKIDDSFVFAILLRYRMAGLETYLLPQSAECPMANRREDIIIEKRK